MTDRRPTPLSDDRGATAVEYGLMIAFIAIVIVAAVTLVGLNTEANFADPALSSAFE